MSDCVQLFIFDLDDEEQQRMCASGSVVLSRDEESRARRLKSELDQRRFVTRCVCVRHVIGRMLRVAPAAVAFRVGKFGKPELADGDGQDGSSLRFNLAHSENLLALATAQALDVGVDIEIVRDDIDVEGLMRTFFDPGECERLRALPAEEQPLAFSELWTRKEALAKATGRGIAQSPGNKTSADEAKDGRWKLQTFQCLVGGQRAVVSLAVETSDGRVTIPPGGSALG